MTENLNENDNLKESSNVAEEFRKDSGEDQVPFYEAITVTKTEVKEEWCETEMFADDMVCENIEEMYIPSSENNFKKETLELTKCAAQSLNENFDVGNCEFKEADRVGTTNCICVTEYKDLSECKTCGYAATSKSLLNRRMLTRCSAKLKKYKCEHCKYAAHRKENVMRHMQIHTNNKPFKCTYKNCKCAPERKELCGCDICGYAAIAKSDLNRHILARHNLETKKYKCNICKYATHRKESLMGHMRIHTNEKPFNCTYKNCKCAPEQKELCTCNTCGYAARIRTDLNRHIQTRHNLASKKYKCNICKYAAHRKESLMRHIRTHTNEKPFNCTYKNCKCAPEQKELCACNTCGYAARFRTDLNRHILTKHNLTSKKYNCNFCVYASHRKGNLMRHMCTHTSEKTI